MKIYTRTGDDGTTGLLGGRRVSKADARVEAYGQVDEANAGLGWARAVALPPLVEGALARAQAVLFQVGAALATPPDRASRAEAVGEAHVTEVEAAIDALERDLPALQTFVLPAGCEGAARLHLARTVCRRAERAVVALAAQEPVDPLLVRYLNRLSDLLFVQARAANHALGIPDVPWRGAS